ncbi:MAG: ABC transporter permease [Isosphaeraceae bacterium]
MWTFAWRNLLTRPVRTALALVGLSIPILGVLGLTSLSDGLKNLVGDTLSQVQGVIVLREGTPSPVASLLPSDMEASLRAVPGVVRVAPEVWQFPPTVENKSLAGKVVRGGIREIASRLTKKADDNNSQLINSVLDMPVLSGQDIAKHQDLRSAIFPRAMKEGRFLKPGDEGSNRIVISRKVARDFPNPDTGKPRQVGDSLDIAGSPYTIIGIYETGSMLLDVTILMDIDTIRRITNVNDQTVSTFYVEGNDPAHNDELSERIEQAIPTADARGVSEIMSNFGHLMGQLDKFLLATVALALIVGVVGIVNTMLMSTTERFAEFGVLRTLGWSRTHVLTLVTAESAYLGFLAGLAGFLLALIFTMVVNPMIGNTGLSLSITPYNAARGLLLSVGMGTLGGLYPAWKASRLVPMAAIRLGAR